MSLPLPHPSNKQNVNCFAAGYKKGTYKTNDREFTRLALKEVSELRRIPTPAEKCISGDFSPEEFARSLQMLKPGKAPGPDSTCL